MLTKLDILFSLTQGRPSGPPGNKPKEAEIMDRNTTTTDKDNAFLKEMKKIIAKARVNNDENIFDELNMMIDEWMENKENLAAKN